MRKFAFIIILKPTNAGKIFSYLRDLKSLLSSKSFWSETVVSVKPLSLKDTLPANSKRNTSLPKVLKSAPSLSILTMVRSSSHFGILLDKKNSVVSEKDITLAPMLLSLCLTSQPESPIRMFPNGTKIWLEFATTSPSSWLEIKSIKRTEKLKPDKSLSTERETFNISIFQPNQTTSMRNHSSGFWRPWLEIQTCTWSKLWLWSQLRFKWTKAKSKSWPANGKKLRTLPFLMKKTKTSSESFVFIFI